MKGVRRKLTGSRLNVPSFCNENQLAHKHDYVVTVLQTPSLTSVSNPPNLLPSYSAMIWQGLRAPRKLRMF